MRKFVIIKNGVVIQTQRSDDDRTVEAPENVIPGMLFDGTNYTMPVETTPNKLKRVKRKKKREIRSAATLELQKLSKELDIGDIKVCRWLWPAIDQSKVNPKLVTLIEIDRLMRVALKAINQATTVSEVDAVSMPVWP